VKKSKFDYDVIVIGSGAAGITSAEIIAKSGKSVAIIEQNRLGGSAPYISDIPTQALTTAAHSLDSARQAAEFGLRTQTVGYSYPLIEKWKNLATRRSGAKFTSDYFNKNGVAVFRGRAHFISKNEISIGRRHLTAEKFVIATGAKPLIPNIAGLNEVDYLTMETAMNLLKPPKSLFVIGAGETGCQLAEMFAIFGTKVYLADAKSRILPREDEQVSELFEEVFLKARGMEVFSSSRVIGIRKHGAMSIVTYLQNGVERFIGVDKVLLATGYAPNTDLGLGNAGVEFDGNGIKVNEFLQTSVKNIWAAGDVLGRFGNVQGAVYEGEIVVANIFGRNKIVPDYRAMSHVIWLSPEVASVGASEIELTRANIKFKTSVVQNSAIERAKTSNFAVGFTKIMTDKDGRILGAIVVAPHAAEIIGELALAIQYGMTAQQIASTIMPFGSWSEVVRLACAQV
jgi:pyruvate/2-oxoglutarate dehydrogenase complex dihydrolipoamide dehydrogenase (E3) component